MKGTDRVQRTSRVASSFIVFWAAGLGFMWWLLTPALMTMRSKTKLKPSAESWLLVCLGIYLILIIAASVAGGVVAANRIPGAAYGALVWIAAGVMFHALRKLTPERNYFFIRGLIFIGSLQGFLSLVAVNVHPSALSKVTLPSSPVIGKLGGVGAWAQSNLAYVDFFGGGIVRSAGLMATAAWSGGFACLILILLIAGRRKLLASGFTPFKWVLAVALNFSSLYYSFSRMSLAILGLLVGIYALYRVCCLLKGGELLATVLMVLGLLSAGTLLPWEKYLLAQDALRPGSSDARFTSYFEGFDVARSEGPLVFLMGNGVKPFLEELGRGAGSESTYVSLLVRGGMVAVTLFVCFLLVRLRRAFKAKDWTGLLLVIALAVHAVVEDLDVGTLTLLLVLIEPARLALASEEPLGLKKAELPPAYHHIVPQQAGEEAKQPEILSPTS